MKNIVGNGLIAKSFKKIDFSKSCLVLASGVSNSLVAADADFHREIELVCREITNNPDSIVLYFSTCSAYQREQNDYVKHKLRMESLVASKASSFHIFRLPQVVGRVKNRTLVSFFVNSILNENHLTIQKNAKRTLIDVDDVARIVKKIVDNEIGINTVQNLASSVSVSALNIACEISEILGCPLKYSPSDSGEEYTIDLRLLKDILGEDDLIFSDNYWRHVLQKYVPLIVEDFSRMK